MVRWSGISLSAFHLVNTTCSCYHGSGLKLLITPILAGLLENNPDKMMEFDQFFSQISRIDKMKVFLCHQLFSSIVTACTLGC